MNFKPKKGNLCILYDNKICNECGECEMCDLDPNKKCDNCGKCLEEMMPPVDEKGFYNFFAELEADPDERPQHTNEAKKDGSKQLAAFLSAYGLTDDCDDDCDCNHDHHDHNCSCHHQHHNHNCDCNHEHHSHDCKGHEQNYGGTKKNKPTNKK